MFNGLFGSGKEELNLSPEQFQSRMKEENSVLVDVRTPEEFQEGHIKGAVNIDYYDDFQIKISKLDKTKSYLLYCRSGSRSYSAVKLMKNIGFNSVSHLEDGILVWNQKLEK